MRDFFAYLPVAEESRIWGASVTSAGHVRTPTGSEYPAPDASHPPDHQFTWSRGRVLETWQILLIQEGGGVFESEPTGRCELRAGSVMIIFPGVWHRYAPDRATGWTESWIEVGGPVLERLCELGKLDRARAVFHPGSQPELTEAMEQCHRLAQDIRPALQGSLSAAALQVLALVVKLQDPLFRPPDYLTELIQRGRNQLVEKCDQPLQIRDLARSLGISESHFRRAFKAETGLSPKSYLLELRLRRVRALLQNSTLTIGEIAERMGYHSAYHLSAEFKKQLGVSPLHWRRERS